MNLTDEEILKARKKNRELSLSDYEAIIQELKDVVPRLIEEGIDVLEKQPYITSHAAKYYLKTEKIINYTIQETIRSIIADYCFQISKNVMTSTEREKYRIFSIRFEQKILTVKLERYKNEDCVIS